MTPAVGTAVYTVFPWQGELVSLKDGEKQEFSQASPRALRQVLPSVDVLILLSSVPHTGPGTVVGNKMCRSLAGSALL